MNKLKISLHKINVLKDSGAITQGRQENKTFVYNQTVVVFEVSVKKKKQA